MDGSISLALVSANALSWAVSTFYNVKVGHGRLKWILFHKAMAFFVSLSYITAITFIQIFRNRAGMKALRLRP